MKDPNNIRLTNGGLICDIIINDDDVNIRCKNNFNHFMEIKMNENLIFQKLTEQERSSTWSFRLSRLNNISILYEA